MQTKELLVETRIVAELADLTARYFFLACEYPNRGYPEEGIGDENDRTFHDAGQSPFEDAGSFLCSVGILETYNTQNNSYRAVVKLRDARATVSRRDKLPTVEEALIECLPLLSDYADPGLPLPRNEEERLKPFLTPWPFAILVEELIEGAWMADKDRGVIWTEKMLPVLRTPDAFVGRLFGYED